MDKKRWILICVVFLICVPLGVNAAADQVMLHNGDTITGTVVENADHVVVKTEALGELTIAKKFIKDIMVEDLSAPASVVEPKLWDGSLSLGYTETRGNTDNGNVTAKGVVHRKTKDDEYHLKGTYEYGSSEKKMDVQKWMAMSRYAYSFGETLKWYHFFKGVVDHDRFANIDYRLLPSTGVGYWFSDAERWKAMVECAGGVQYVHYRSGSDGSSTDAMAVFRVFVEKTFFKNTTLSEDLYIYPYVTDYGEYRVVSETLFTNPINDHLSLEISFTDEYNSAPAQGIDKNDATISSSLVYSF